MYTKHRNSILLTLCLAQGLGQTSLAHDTEVNSTATNSSAVKAPSSCLLLTAKQLFDGVNFPQENKAVLLEGGKIKKIGSPNELSSLCAQRYNLGDATILPGFIESHAHITFQNVNKDIVLKHGITTAQDTGGPLLQPEGGVGSLRLLSVGPIIQAPGGYPLNVFGGSGGYDKIGYPVSSATAAQEVVTHLIEGGATAIKVALEPGGETGAPWMQPHDGPVPATPWPMLSDEVLKAIVSKAHALGKRVIAHVGEEKGFTQALNAQVDELAHMPCAPISDTLLQRAVDQGMTFVTTIDTLASCVNTSTQLGIHSNTMLLAKKGAKFIYGSEIAHDNVPWGINGEEMHMMLHLTSGDAIDFTDVVNVFKAVTSKAGERLGIPGLGTLTEGAPADVIAVKGNPFAKFKLLEYPDLVISGGYTVVNNFKPALLAADTECLFSWAEKQYPALFAPAGVFTEFTAAYHYRNYPNTHTALGVSTADNQVYYQNAAGNLQSQGAVQHLLATAGCQ